MSIVKLKRGNSTNFGTVVLQSGEPAFILDTGKLYINNGTSNILINPDSSSSNTPNTIVLRDASGNFSAGTITATLSGNATSATNLSGGSIGTIPYQTAANTTAQLAVGSSKQVLTSNGSAAPSWQSLDLTYLPSSTFKESVKVATITDLSASTQTTNTLTGYGISQSLACSTTSGSTTVTTTSTAGLKVGAVVSIATSALAAGTTVATIASSTSFTVNNRAAITTTAITSNGTTATATFTAQTYTPYAVGSSIVITGAVPTTYNGTFTVTACSTTSVSWASTETTTATTQGTINFNIATASSTTTNFAQSISALVIDGITLALNDRILVRNQSTVGGIAVTANRDNGIYYVSTLGTTSVPWVLTRTPDADSAAEIASGLVAVDSGTTYGGCLFDNDFRTTDTLGATAMVWNSIADNGRKLNYFSTTSSSELASIISDETGSGSLVFATSPTLTTPTISGNVTMSTGGILLSTNNAIAAAGTTQATATALTKDLNSVTSGTGGVSLPTAAAGREIIVCNNTASTIIVYPATGGYIDALAQNAGVSLPAGSQIKLAAMSTTNWESSMYFVQDWNKIINKPVNLSGYGITDATPSSHVGATGTAHGVATSSVNGFMPSTDKVKLDGLLSSVSTTLPATAGWYRIAQSTNGINRNAGRFEIDWILTGRHGQVTFNAANMYGLTTSNSLNQLLYSNYSAGTGITKARIVYNTTYASNYAYLEIYNAGADALAINIQLLSTLGWSLITPAAGSIPSGYLSEEITFYAGIVTNDQLVSEVTTGTSPLQVNSTTVVTNLNADMVDGYNFNQGVQTSNAPTFSGLTLGGSMVLTAANGGIELGNTTTSNTPYIDFHSSGSTNDYDTRILASGGTSGTAGAGSLALTAAGGVSFNGQIKSSVASGTAPITVTSNTLVTNLNADKVDNMDATSSNTASTIVSRDSSGNFSAGTITATLSGNSSSATKLATAKTITLTGDITGLTSFDGSSNVSILTALADGVIGSVVTATSDWNNYTTAGFYCGDGLLNSPPAQIGYNGNNKWYVLCITNGNYVYQIAYPYNGGSNSIYRRSYCDDSPYTKSWTSWGTDDGKKYGFGLSPNAPYNSWSVSQSDNTGLYVGKGLANGPTNDTTLNPDNIWFMLMAQLDDYHNTNVQLGVEYSTGRITTRTRDANGENTWNYVPFMSEFAAKHVIGSDGYQKTANGTIIQWGYDSIAAAGTQIIFPTSFPLQCAAVVINAYNSSNFLYTYSQTKSSFYAKSNATSAIYANWIAIGW